MPQFEGQILVEVGNRKSYEIWGNTGVVPWHGHQGGIHSSWNGRSQDVGKYVMSVTHPGGGSGSAGCATSRERFREILGMSLLFRSVCVFGRCLSTKVHDQTPQSQSETQKGRPHLTAAGKDCKPPALPQTQQNTVPLSNERNVGML